MSDGERAFLYGQGRIGQQGAAGMDYFLTDALGSVRQLVGEAGEVSMAKAYRPYGEVLDTAGSAETMYGFTGEWTDATGLVHLRARYYEPRVGRFLTRDPWKGDMNKPMSYNAWLYVYSNPINSTDPTGYIAQGEAKQADKLLDRLKGTYNVHIIKDWGEIWTYDLNGNPPGMKCGWEGGLWRSLRELQLVEEALHAIAPGRMTTGQFLDAFKKVKISRSTDLRGPFAPPGVWAYLLGNIVITDGIMNNIPADEEWIRLGIVHEFGHVWDYRTKNELSIGLMQALGTWVWSGDTGNAWAPGLSPEIYPGTPLRCIDRITGIADYSDPTCRPYSMTFGDAPLFTGPGAEDWAVSFSLFVYPDGYKKYRQFSLVPGGIRETYVREKIQNIK